MTLIEDDIASLGPWFHNLHLPDGRQTCPDHWAGDFPAFKWNELAPHVPQDLSGWSCLDIGCNAGFYTFELARRGAHVLGIDLDDRYLTQARWAAGQYGDDVAGRVRFERMQVYDLARLDERFDLVLFMGVLYHLRYPMLGLDTVAQKVRRLMVFQTMTMPGDEVYEDPRPRVHGPRPDAETGVAEDGVHRTPLRVRPHQLVGRQPRGGGGDAPIGRNEGSRQAGA